MAHWFLKILISFSVFSIVSITASFSQDNPGRPIAEIFSEFQINLTDTTKKTGFNLNRAYLGYQFTPAGNISAKIIINLGAPDDLPNGSEPHRYAFYREASLTWTGEKITAAFGITGTRIFDFQQRFWGKRYIANTYQAVNGYGTVADLGLAVDYVFNEYIKADVTLMNGEGYSNLQLDNNLRASVGLTITPMDKLAIRLYGDIQKAEDLWQPVFIGFAGFKNELITFGGEFSYKSNIDIIQGHHVFGFSATGGININEKTEIFSRFDFISSVVMENTALKWNYMSDGNFIVAGIQRTLSPNAKIALNYQGFYPYSTAGLVSDLLSVNAIFKL